ncbi:hypothetical protein EDD68_10281 [Melghiribacillus thermohalophilus]|uniref:ABC-2 type transport system permease protein n=1 Tax=Melghiribacillus thermohalophilus TaxID=1324956 RepID=A0A4R3ND47_9BACI|nr:hypothetical protein [Melghiribacillus thermohalophilus]TCT26380.1 hypothetical protein EDD68_10281 [Melghiribacillus thermohalophilus]
MNQLKFEIKNMGFHFYLPIIVFLFVSILLIMLPTEQYEIQFFILLQVLFIPLSAWWSIFLVYELYHHQAEEILIQFYSHKLLINYVKFVSIFLLMLLVTVTLLGVKSAELNIGELFILLTSQVLVISSFGLLLAIFFKSVETSLMAIIMYVATELITLGDLFPWPHIFYFAFNFTVEEISTFGIVSLFVSAAFLIFSFFFVKRIERHII